MVRNIQFFMQVTRRAATFDAEFSNVTRSCAGKGVARRSGICFPMRMQTYCAALIFALAASAPRRARSMGHPDHTDRHKIGIRIG
jgi:hypothetical protein